MGNGTTVAAVTLAMAGIVSALIGATLIVLVAVGFDGVPRDTPAEVEAAQTVQRSVGAGGGCCCLSSVALLSGAGFFFWRRRAAAP